MNKIRCCLATIALLAALGGPVLQGMASGSMANAAAIRSASATNSSFATGKSAKSIAARPYGPCPVPGTSDC